ncbi:phage tail terminator protein [Mannheimia haemolytica]|uniref:phage tail terminator protein n=1 Tax=Mannheimia haemolytica TaxID=75985 RepID=UPI001378819B|nr:phage tail terminator protein [Mannheimia haemolytica]NBB67554.1 hypothetical protein [Mannheimia haemolytica]
MKIHNEIRKEVISVLSGKYSGFNYYNGIPKIKSTDEELPLISVMLNNIEADPVTIGHIEYNGVLSLVIFIPFFDGEEYLDEIAEQISNTLKHYSFKNFEFEDGYNQRYEYEFDQENRAWVSAMIDYKIRYGFERFCIDE